MAISGIYLITNLENGKVYIGSSSSITERWSEHKRLLSKGLHHSEHLQNAFNKYGKKAFSWEILEKIPTSQLCGREQYWITAFNSAKRKHGYNVCPVAGTTLGIKLNLSPEERARRKTAMLENTSIQRIRCLKGTKSPRYGYRKAACKYGHPRVPENINTIGCCRTCANKYSREWQYKKRHKLS